MGPQTRMSHTSYHISETSLDDDLRRDRVDSERVTTERTTRLRTQPLVETIRVVAMAAAREDLDALAVLERAEADATLAGILRRRPVRDHREALNLRRVEPTRLGSRSLRRRRGRSGRVAVTAGPARVEEEEREDEEDREDYDDEEESLSSHLEVSVVEHRVVPL